MAEAQNGERLQKAAESVVLTLVSRWFVIILVPATLGLGGYIGNRVVTGIDALITKVDQQHEQTVRIENKLDVRVTGLEHDMTGAQRDIEALQKVRQ